VAARKVHLIAAARPNFMKVAPLWHALQASGDYAPVLVHTGQHYDPNMSAAVFADLKLPDPDFHLGIGSGSHAEQTGKVLIARCTALRRSVSTRSESCSGRVSGGFSSCGSAPSLCWKKPVNETSLRRFRFLSSLMARLVAIR